jgi:glycosyltransferase involved in cell wall biosynthesis
LDGGIFIKKESMASILVLLQEYFPKDTRVRKEVMALIEKGHSIDIVCLRGDNEVKYEESGLITIHRIGSEKKRASVLRYLYEYFSFFFVAFYKTWRISKAKVINIVHVHTIPDFLVFAAFPAKKRGAKVILDMHEIMPEFFCSKYRFKENHIVVKVLKYIERASVMYADYIITVNSSLKEIFEKRSCPKRDIVEVLNTVSNDTLPVLEKQTTNKFVAVYHGTLTDIYNLSFAISSMGKVSKKLRDLNFEFHVYGDGPDFRKLQELVDGLQLQGMIFVHGRVKHTEIPGILSKANLGILPMRRDLMLDLSFSNKLAEYVHCKIPVLSSDLITVKRYFPEDCLFYYKHDSQEEFISQLFHVIENREEAIQFAERASLVNKSISWEVMKERLIQLIQEALNEK